MNCTSRSADGSALRRERTASALIGLVVAGCRVRLGAVPSSSAGRSYFPCRLKCRGSAAVRRYERYTGLRHPAALLWGVQLDVEPVTRRRDSTPRTRSIGRCRSAADRCPSDRTCPPSARPPRQRSAGCPSARGRPAPRQWRPPSPSRCSSRACSGPRDVSSPPIPSVGQPCTTGGTYPPLQASLIIVHVCSNVVGDDPGSPAPTRTTRVRRRRAASRCP